MPFSEKCLENYMSMNTLYKLCAVLGRVFSLSGGCTVLASHIISLCEGVQS